MVLCVFASGCCGDHGCCGDVRGYGTGELAFSYAGLTGPSAARTTGIGDDEAAHERMWDILIDSWPQDPFLPNPGAAAFLRYDSDGRVEQFVVAAWLDGLDSSAPWTRCGATVSSVKLVIRQPDATEFEVALEDASGAVIETWSHWGMETTDPFQFWSDGWAIDWDAGGLSGVASFTSPPVDGCIEPAEGARFEITWSFDDEPEFRDRLLCGW